MEDIMDIVHITNKGKIMDTLERYYMYKETKSINQINDKLTVKSSAIFETLIHKAPYRGHSNSVTKRPKHNPVVLRHSPPPEVKDTLRQKAVRYYTQNQQLPALGKTCKLYIPLILTIYIYIYQCSKQLERLVKPGSVNYRLRRKDIVRENTGPQQSATNEKKIHNHLKTTEEKTTA
jgi:hypothetical protein